MSKVLFTVIFVVFAALMGIVNVVKAQARSYYGNGYNYGYQPSNYLSAYPQQFSYGDGSTPGDTWHQSLASTLWP